MSTPVERVRSLITQSGLSQGDFAARVGLDAPKLSKSLAGTRRFTSLDLARIADLGGVSVDWLLTGEEAPVAMAARSASGSPSDKALRLGARLAELRGIAADLGHPQHTIDHGVDGSGLPSLAYEAGGQLAERAVRWLASKKLNPTQEDLAPVIEAGFGIEVAVADLAGLDGLAVRSDQARLIVLAPTAQAGRHRFTMAHELGHLLAGDDQGIHLDRDVMARGRDITEIRANAFAAAFLMPERFLKECAAEGIDHDRFCGMAMDLLVSPSSLAYRLQGLGLIAKDEVDVLRAITLADAARATGRVADLARAIDVTNATRPPPLLARDLLSAYLDKRTTLRPYAELIGRPTREVRAELEGSSR